MIKNFIQIIKRCIPLLILAGTLSCDSLDGDFIQPENQVTFTNTEYFILPGSAIIIDLKSVVKQAFSDVRLTISAHPSRGQLSTLDTMMVTYKPFVDFLDGQDQFTLSVLGNGKIITTQILTIIMKQDKDELPCALFAIHDEVNVKSDTSISIRFRENDRVCGMNNAALGVSVYSNPRFGEGRLVGDSIVVYTPGPEFSGYDEMVYKLTTSSGEITAYGLITVTDKPKIQVLKRPPGSVMIFIDENTGFVAGSGIYKTTDGGTSWIKVYEKMDTYGYFTAIQFIDANNGFAAYSACLRPGECNSGYFLRTSDGGSSWKLVRFDVPIGSVFFTSSTTGFVGYYQNATRINGVFKTEDGGETWNEVISDPQGYGALQVRFADATTGYAYSYNRVYKTTNGGVTWKLSIANSYVSSLEIAPDNTICAVFTTDEDLPQFSPSSINKSTDGISWESVAQFQSPTAGLAFSPSGAIGFAIGTITSPPVFYSVFSDLPLSPLSITETRDYGATWQQTDVDEHLVGQPLGIAIPSNEVVYFLCSDKLIRYSTK